MLGSYFLNNGYVEEFVIKQKSFLIKVSDRKTETLLMAIKNSIQKGTTISSDCWHAYNSELLKPSVFNNYTVNHAYNFVDLTTGVHT